MKILSYVLLAVLLTGGTSVFGQEDKPTPERVRLVTRAAEQGVSMSMLNIYSILRPLSMPQLEGVPWRIRSR